MDILSRAIKTAILGVSLSFYFSVSAFAQAYDCGTYGAGNFGEGGACDVAAGDTADTGLNTWLLRGLAVILILLAAYLIWRIAKKRK